VTVGPAAEEAARAARAAGLEASQVHHVADAASAAALLLPLLRWGDSVLVKGSRALALEVAVERLADAGRPRA
jgi:UDP-N-acetylmuramyl pentapeptide synthase